MSPLAALAAGGVAVLNTKGGTGKTTTAIYLATALAQLGHNTLVMDTDPARSLLRWADVAAEQGAPFEFTVTAPWSTRDVAGSIVRAVNDRDEQWSALVVDTPPIEDHAAIVRDALTVVGTALIPVAPAGVELDRMTAVGDVLAGSTARRCVLLNRTSWHAPTRSGADADMRAILTERGYHVLPQQIRHLIRYQDAWGAAPDLSGTPWTGVATHLITQHEESNR